MEQLERRRLLNMDENPDSRSDYVVTIGGEFAVSTPNLSAAIEIRYIPDRDVINETAFHAYLAVLADQQWESLEEVATTILGDLSNQLVPRWMQVSIEQILEAGQQRTSHAVFLEDRQPNWDNPSLLSRLKLQ